MRSELLLLLLLLQCVGCEAVYAYTFRVPRFFHFFPSKATLTHAAQLIVIVVVLLLLSSSSSLLFFFFVDFKLQRFILFCYQCVYRACVCCGGMSLGRYSHTIYAQQKRTLSVLMWEYACVKTLARIAAKIRDRWRAHIQKSYGNIIAALAVAAATGIAVAAASTEMPHIAAVRKSLSRKLISQISTTNKSQICNFYHMENEKTEFSSRQFVFNFTFKRESYRLHIIEYPN